MTYLVGRFFDLFYSITHIFSVNVIPQDVTSFYDIGLTVKDASGSDINLSRYQGKVNKIVNCHNQNYIKYNYNYIICYIYNIHIIDIKYNMFVL